MSKNLGKKVVGYLTGAVFVLCASVTIAEQLALGTDTPTLHAGTSGGYYPPPQKEANPIQKWLKTLGWSVS